MGQRIHAGRGSKPLRHRCHHIRVDDRDHRHIVRIYADKLAFPLHIGDDIVDGHFRGSAGRGRYRDDRYAGIARRRSAFQAAHILEFRVRDDDADRFGRIHGRAAADGDDIIGLSSLERSNALLHIFNGRIGLDVRIDLISEGILIEDIGHFSGHPKADQVRVRADKGFLIPSCLCFRSDLLNRARTMIRCLIQHDSIGHIALSFACNCLHLQFSSLDLSIKVTENLICHFSSNLRKVFSSSAGIASHSCRASCSGASCAPSMSHFTVIYTDPWQYISS